MRRLAVIAALAALAGGCGGGGNTACVEGATTRAQTRAAPPTAYLTDVAVETHGCADRVTFTFAKRVPGYRVEYVPPAQAKIEDGSGRHLDIAGTAFLVVRLSPAQTARIGNGGITRTYTGPRRLPVNGAHHVQEMVKTGDFEALLTWAVGLDEKRPFAVDRSGRSLVVDLG